jgi:crotonobetainyl-CoA:carnitine CoA-transferase CaiB-like acyl-CoA transferase
LVAAAVAPADVLTQTWRALGGDPDALEHVSVAGRDPVLPSSYPLGALSIAAVGVATMAAAEVWHARTRQTQRVTLTVDDCVRACRSDQLVHVDGARPGNVWNAFSGFYATGDDRFVQLHTNFAHHLERTLRVLGVGEDRDAVAQAIAERKGTELETALAEAGACAALARTRNEWVAHPQGAAIASLPLLDTRVAAGTSAPLPAGDRPLAGVRVLDLTRVIAGPVATRTLAAHGADVLRVSAAHLPEIDMLLPDTALGKRSTLLDLREASDAAQFRALVAGADVIVQSYRPGALDSFGFSFDDARALQPNITYVSLSAYSHAGPWAGRRGYDTLVQTASGIALAEAESFGADRPRHLPISGLDHATGYFAAAAAMRALADRHHSGGARHVRCSLAQTRDWLETLGRIDGTATARPDDAAIVATLPAIDSAYGRVTYAPPGGTLEDTPAQWTHGAVTPGSSPAAWTDA